MYPHTYANRNQIVGKIYKTMDTRQTGRQMYLHTDCQKNPTYLETTVYGTQKNDALDTGS